MIRVLLVIGGIAVVFVVTLVVGGNVLGAWEPAKPATAPAPRAAERTPRGLVEVKTPSRSQAPRRRTPSRPSWVAQLDALCRSAEAEALLTAPPGSVAELKESLKKSARMSARWNGAAAKLLALAAPTHSRSRAALASTVRPGGTAHREGDRRPGRR
jgi:hypothetical protein